MPLKPCLLCRRCLPSVSRYVAPTHPPLHLLSHTLVYVPHQTHSLDHAEALPGTFPNVHLLELPFLFVPTTTTHHKAELLRALEGALRRTRAVRVAPLTCDLRNAVLLPQLWQQLVLLLPWHTEVWVQVSTA